MHILEAVLYGHMDGSGNKSQTKNSIHWQLRDCVYNGL